MCKKADNQSFYKYFICLLYIKNYRNQISYSLPYFLIPLFHPPSPKALCPWKSADHSCQESQSSFSILSFNLSSPVSSPGLYQNIFRRLSLLLHLQQNSQKLWENQVSFLLWTVSDSCSSSSSTQSFTSTLNIQKQVLRGYTSGHT